MEGVLFSQAAEYEVIVNKIICSHSIKPGELE
jgi:hypothetical protein